MLGNVTTKAIIYNFYRYSKVDKNGEERGLICINYLMPTKEEDGRRYGWKTMSSWVRFDDELFKYLKSTLIKQSDLELSFREDYRNSTNFICEITKINDFSLKS